MALYRHLLARPAAAFALSLVAIFVASPVVAQSTAVILGLRSVEGDDDVAHDMTRALRAAVPTSVSWKLSDREVSLTQMALAHGCEEVDAACLSHIAESLETKQVVYGTLRRTSAHAEYDYELALSLFDGESGAIERTVTETIPRAQAGFRSFSEHAERLLKKVANESRHGSIAIAVNVPSAAVLLDGSAAGEATDGALRLEEIAPGEHRVEIRASGYAPHAARVEVVAGEEASVRAELAAESAQIEHRVDLGRRRGSSLEWLGWTLVGVGAASLVGMGASALVVQGVEDDSLFVEYKGRVARDNALAGFEAVNDVCAEAERGLPHGLDPASKVEEVADLCSTADTFEVLQWVFLGTAVVSGGAGAYILLTSDSDEPEAEPAVSLRPSFDGQSARVDAALRF